MYTRVREKLRGCHHLYFSGYHPKEGRKDMRERDVERSLIIAVRKTGGLCLKWVSPGWDGAPDRVCLWPGGRVAFVEVKRPGAKPRPLQIRRLEQLRRLGFLTAVVDGQDAIHAFIKQFEDG